VSAHRLDRCHWPTLASPYADALRDAVAFVMAETEPVGIIATGTIVSGAPHASSDLDVFVVHEAPYRRRVQRFFNGVPTEIFLNPAATVRRYFAEEHRDGRPITAHMIATGVVVFQCSPVIEELRREAGEWLGRISPLGDDEIVRQRYAAASRFEDAVDVAASDPDTSAMLMGQAVTAMLEHDCRVKDGRIPRGKDLLGAVARRDPELSALARTFYSATSHTDRIAAGQAIADRTVGHRGFFEWDSGSEPVRSTSGDDDRAAIEAVRDAWVAVVASGDGRGLADFVTQDYEVWTHGAPALGGPKTVVAVMSAALAKYSVTQSFEPTETVVSGDWAFQRGIERIRAVPRDGGTPQENVQRALVILRRGDDGRWRYARGMTNGLPPSAPSSSAD
jgi:uncharacterized protein (TIGR02246 family)